MSRLQPTSTPRWIVLQLVEACNLRCRMCYEWGDRGVYRHVEAPAQLDFEIIERIVRECESTRPYFELFGGEPFLHPRIDDVIRCILDGGSVLGIPTNGTLIQDHADTLVGGDPVRVWVSLDGPEEINDQQRGQGSFRRAMAGIEAILEARERGGHRYPQLGITYIVTPRTAAHVLRCFHGSLDLARLDFVSIVLENFATSGECDAYERVVVDEFGGSSARFARGYLRDPGYFRGIDCRDLSQQIAEVRRSCIESGVAFFTNPTATDTTNLEHYFAARWHRLADRRSRCAFPWMYAEVTARGELATCHSFYDITFGNLRERSILDVWQGEGVERVRNRLRGGLFPICTACCRYYTNPNDQVLNGTRDQPASVPNPDPCTSPEGNRDCGAGD